jgi:uroporphyrinogen-III synthase
MKTVVLTQPFLRAAELAQRLQALGYEPLAWPMSEIAEAEGIDWPALIERLAACRWVLLPSPGAISVVMAALARHGLAWPAATGIGLIGPGSREALAGWYDRVASLADAPTLAPEGPLHDADALLERPEFAALLGVGVAVLRRADGRESWLHTLRDRGAALAAIDVYRARPADPPADAAAWLAARAADDRPFAISVASADAGRRLAAFVAGLACADWVRGRPVLTQHPRIAQALREQGWRSVRKHPPGLGGLSGALESMPDRGP